MRARTTSVALLVAMTVAGARPAAAGPRAKAPEPVASVEVGEEVDVTAGAVTALSCALLARDHNKLEAITGCPLAEASKEIVVYDVADKQIYRVSKKAVFRYELEKAFGGGSLDFSGVVKSVQKGIATVDVEEYSVTPKPKPGAFKGCL